MVAVLGVFVLLALLNTFGQDPTTSEADAGPATLRVSAPTHLRGGLIFQVRVDVTAHSRLGKPSLVFSSGWFEQMSLNAILPQPSTQTSSNGLVTFQLPPMPAGRESTWWFYFQANPTNVGWNRPEVLQLDDGSATVAQINRTISVYP